MDEKPQAQVRGGHETGRRRHHRSSLRRRTSLQGRPQDRSLRRDRRGGSGPRACTRRTRPEGPVRHSAAHLAGMPELILRVPARAIRRRGASLPPPRSGRSSETRRDTGDRRNGRGPRRAAGRDRGRGRAASSSSSSRARLACPRPWNWRARLSGEPSAAARSRSVDPTRSPTTSWLPYLNRLADLLWVLAGPPSRANRASTPRALATTTDSAGYRGMAARSGRCHDVRDRDPQPTTSGRSAYDQGTRQPTFRPCSRAAIPPNPPRWRNSVNNNYAIDTIGRIRNRPVRAP